MDLSKSLKVKYDGAIGILINGFLLMFNSNIEPLQDIGFRNLSDLEFALSNSLKVKCDDAIGLPIYNFLAMVNGAQPCPALAWPALSTLSYLILSYLILS